MSENGRNLAISIRDQIQIIYYSKNLSIFEITVIQSPHSSPFRSITFSQNNQIFAALNKEGNLVFNHFLENNWSTIKCNMTTITSESLQILFTPNNSCHDPNRLDFLLVENFRHLSLYPYFIDEDEQASHLQMKVER